MFTVDLVVYAHMIVYTCVVVLPATSWRCGCRRRKTGRRRSDYNANSSSSRTAREVAPRVQPRIHVMRRARALATERARRATGKAT